MKVGTDSVLLACLTDVSASKVALDVGTGTGIIALMLAQKNNHLLVDAIEIEEQAFLQATDNVKKSKFNTQIHIYHQALQTFEPVKQYDLIISNPPYFISKSNYSIQDKERANARHDASLPFSVFLQQAFSLLTDEGSLSVILPTKESKIWLELALQHGFFLHKEIHIKPKPSKPYNRVVMAVGKQAKTLPIKEYTIYEEDGTQTNWYKTLCAEFYL